MPDQGSQATIPPFQCSCRGPAQLLPFDENIWKETVEEFTHHPHEKVTKADGYDANSNQPIPGFVNLVTNRRPIVPYWLYRLLRGRKALEDDKNYEFCVNLADVQRMHLRLLQGRLTWLALSAGFDKDRDSSQKVLTELGPTLRDYGKSDAVEKARWKNSNPKRTAGNEAVLMRVISSVQAVRDHEYMGHFSGQTHDPFRVSSERFQERELLEKLLQNERLKAVGDFCWLKNTATPTGPWEEPWKDGKRGMRPIGGTRGEAFRQALWSRAAGALVGAAFLIGPMWPLVLKQDIYLQLGVTTGCIVAFGSVMVFALRTLEAVFAATLAYAAVLMVFVGVVMQSVGKGS